MRLLTPYRTNRNFSSDLFDEMERFFDEWNRPSTTPQVYDERNFHPACEVTEADGHYLMSVDLPGMKKSDIKIEVIDGILTVSGERKRESQSDPAERVQRFEKYYGSFKRSFTLPVQVEADKVEARYEDGVLELYLPKAAAVKPRSVEIQSGKSGIFEKLLNTKSAKTT